MQIDVIYTFKHDQQKFATYPFANCLLQNKELLIEFLTSNFTVKELYIDCLTKISFSIIIGLHDKDFELPKWVEECNGKLYFEKGELG